MKRIQILQKRLKEWNVDRLLIENPIDLFYLTHLKMSKGRLWVDAEQADLWVDGRYFGAAQKMAPCAVFLWEKGREAPQKGRVGFDSIFTTVDALEKLRFESPLADWVPIRQPLKMQRLIKEPSEIEFLRQAARITWEGIEHIQKKFIEGISEQELAFEFEFFVRKKGASGLAFESIIAFGENSAYPHHRSSDTRLQKNQIILVDVGAVVQQYHADVTRTFFFKEPDSRLQEMAEIVQAASRAAYQQIRVNGKIGDLDRAARDVFIEKNVESFFTHNLGHGLGLETHESPTIRWDGEDREMRIQPQMVIAVEPGLYRPGIGGVRYENSGVVTNHGFESFYPLV